MPARTDAATAVRLRNQADRAVDDPVKLAKAVRIVAAAIGRNKLTVDDLTQIVVSGGSHV